MIKFLPRVKSFLLVFALSVGLEPCLNAQTLLKVSDYGINNAKSGVERYKILLNVHKDAIEQGKGISYEGIDSLFLDIPQNPQSIPLPAITDFAGVNIIVENRQKNFHLFTMQGKKETVIVKNKQLRRGNYRAINALEKGVKVLILEDINPWIKQRKGYDVGVTRKDILYLKNGRAKNKPIQSYTTSSTNVKAYWFEGSVNTKEVKNLIFRRSANSTKETFLIRLDCQDKVMLSNIIITTPKSDMYADQIISITDCSNIMCENIKIDGTYSQKNKYGYGISMNNVWNSTFDQIDAKGEWGVFGTYNVNHSIVKNSRINRFDIHCYGRDIYMENCEFRDLYNQISSVYGDVVFSRCCFVNCTPLLIESSFNAYTPFNVTWKDCLFYLDKSHNCLMHLGGITDVLNERQELREKQLPNINVENCKIIIPEGVEKWTVLQTGDVKGTENIRNKSIIRLKNILTEGFEKPMIVISDETLIQSKVIRIKII